MVYSQIREMAVMPLFLTCSLLMQGAGMWAQTDTTHVDIRAPEDFPRPEFGVEYIAEGQNNLQGDAKMLHFMHLSASLPMNRFAFLDIAAISVLTSSAEPIVGDFQVFSNIDAENVPIALAVLGLRFPIREKHTLFVGIRNINEDYFTSGITSFYTNSSCGVFPTISANFGIANYPESAPAIHYRYEDDSWGLNASVYHDGYLITQAEYTYPGLSSCQEGTIFGGLCLRPPFPSHAVAGCTAESSPSEARTMATLWAYVEQSLTSRLSLIAGYSHAFGRDLECTDFAGLGLHCKHRNAELGIFSDYAHGPVSEFATELSAKFSFADHFYLQPTVHLITTDHVSQPSKHLLATDHVFRPVCLLRFGVEY